MSNFLEKQQLYGREQETEKLQRIIDTFRLGIHDGGIDAPIMEYNKDVPIFRICSTNKTAVSNVSANSCTTDCDGVSHNNNNNNSSFVLIHGPQGCGKKIFAYQTLQNMPGCISDTSSSVDESKQIDVSDFSSIDSPFLFVSGQYKAGIRRSNYDPTAPTAKQRIADERPFAAFDEAIAGIMRIISKNDTLSNEIRVNLMSIMTSPSEIDVLRTSFPSMGEWLNDQNSALLTQSMNKDSKSTLIGDQRTPGISTLDFKRTLHGIQLMEQQLYIRCPAMIHFIQAVFSVVPVTMLLVDVHYADAASISLMESLIFIQETYEAIERKIMKPLLIVATYQTDIDDATSDKLLSLLIRCQISCTCSHTCKFCNLINSENSHEMVDLPENNDRRTIPTINSICLSELKWDNVNMWIKANSTFKMYPSDKQNCISDLVYHHCDGNPFRAQYVILYLEAYSLQHEINKIPIPRTLGELYSKVLLLQNKSVQDIIKAAAALIHSGFDDVSLDIIEIATGQLCTDILIKAEENKMIQFQHATNTLNFSHDEFHEAAYDTIPIEDRPQLHLKIGRRIWKNAIMQQDNVHTTRDDSSIKVMLATLQIRNSISLLSDINERLYMSKLCYETGIKLISVGDDTNAAVVLDFAIRVLGTDIWRDDIYEASLALHNATVQAYCFSGDFNAMDKVLDAIFTNARSFHDQVPGYVALIYTHGIRNQLVEAVRTIIMVLKELGEPLHTNPSQFEMVKHMLRTQWLLRGKTDTYFFNLPIAEDDSNEIVAHLLSFALHFTFVKSPEMCIVICCRMLQLALTKGMTAPTIMALSVYGCFLSGSGNFDKGYQFGQIAIQLVDKFEAWIPRTYLYFYGYTTHWVHPIRDSIEPLKHAADIACKFGDLELYGLCSCFCVISMFYSGSQLSLLEKKCRSGCESNVDLQYNKLYLFFVSTLSFILKLTGSNIPFNTSNEIKDAESALKYSIKDGNRFFIGRYYLEQMIWYYLIGEYVTSLAFAKKTKKINPVSEYNLPFYEGLLEFAYTWTCTSYVQRQKHKYRGYKILNVLKKWSKRCPSNFDNKYMLLLAEYNALVGRTDTAFHLFEKSIMKANEEGFISEVAIAYERQGQYQLRLNQKIEAIVSFEHAKDAYAKWGSKPLCRRIDGVLLTIV